MNTFSQRIVAASNELVTVHEPDVHHDVLHELLNIDVQRGVSLCIEISGGRDLIPLGAILIKLAVLVNTFSQRVIAARNELVAIHEANVHDYFIRLGLFKQCSQGIGFTRLGSGQFLIVCHRQSIRERPAVKCVAGVCLIAGECQFVCSVFSGREDLGMTRFITRQLAVGAGRILNENLVLVSNLIAVCIHIPLGGIRRVSSYRFCDLGRPAAENIACAGGYTVKCGSLSALGYGFDLVGEDLFIFYTVGVGDGVLRLKRGFLQANFSNQFSFQNVNFLGIQVDCYSV